MTKEADLKEQLIRAGDEKAFESFYRMNFNRLIAYVQMFVRDIELAKDIAQHSFIKLWEKGADIPREVPLKSYLFAIAKNHFIDTYRERRKEYQLLEKLKVLAVEEYHLEELENRSHKLELLQRAIENLPPKCRVILLLSKREGLQYKQIAQHLGISVKTVEAQMRIAYTKIREYGS